MMLLAVILTVVFCLCAVFAFAAAVDDHPVWSAIFAFVAGIIGTVITMILFGVFK